MRILDLFCHAGGASMGYHRAFPDAEIVGVDVLPQPRYPFTFRRGDALDYPLDGFDLIHASPPCRDHSRVAGRLHTYDGSGWMLNAMIDRLRELREVPWVVENVEGTRFPDDVRVIRLCGSSFMLDLRRHRLFASNVMLDAPPCNHGWQTPRFPSMNNANRKAGKLSPVVGVHGNMNHPGDFKMRCDAMGIHWMTWRELNDAIPPAYTEWIGNEIKESHG